MKHVIICEGNTDLTLIQYFMEKVHGWEHIKESDYKSFEEGTINKIRNAKLMKWFKHPGGAVLSIMSAGGVSRIPGLLNSVLDMNQLGSIVPFSRIVIISDRDEIQTEQHFLNEIIDKFDENAIQFAVNPRNNEWNTAVYTNAMQDQLMVDLLPLIVPFEQTGAIETFLLQALSNASEQEDPDQADKHVIDQCIQFIETIDCKDKYLRKRRERTKAKFDTTFVVMTPAEAFGQRRDLLRSVPWEKFELIQVTFKHLRKLSEL